MRTLTFATTLCVLLAPVAAQAATATVDFADLDLSTPAGKAVLEQRVSKAALAVCSPEEITGSRLRGAPDRECLADARAQIDAQLARHLARRTAATELAARSK